MKPPEHVGIGFVWDDEFHFDRTATVADLWRFLWLCLRRHPFRTVLKANRYYPGKEIQ